MSAERKRFVLFVLAGGTAALVNILSRIALNWVMPYEVAIIVAYLCGMTTAYLLNKYFVFAASGRGVASEYTRFALVNLAAVAQVWIVSVGLARLVFPAIGFAWHAETVAHVIGVAIPVFTSYLGHKHFSFAAKG
jgi:putative flippase GtrA